MNMNFEMALNNLRSLYPDWSARDELLLVALVTIMTAAIRDQVREPALRDFNG